VTKALPGADEFMLTVHLHPAFNELDGSNNETDDDSREGAILKAIHIAEFSFVPKCFVGFIRTEDKCMDYGIGN
jgi:hypothetical protein